jgi:Protein of unknown function DUF47
VAALRESALGRLFGRAPDYGELFGLLRQAGENIRRSTALLAQLIARWPEENGERHDLVDCEHEGDYKVEAPMEQAVALAGVLEQAGAKLAEVLDRIDRVDGLMPYITEIGRLEDEGDRIERECLAALFEGGIDPMLVIRWKDIVERLEQGIDSCDHVGHVLEGVVVKHA